MSMDIYAGKMEAHPDYGQIMGPVIPFDSWRDEVLAPDADERHMRGENPFIVNPDYVPDAGLTLSNANTRALFDALGFDIDEGAHLPIDAVARAAMKGLNGAAAQVTTPYTEIQGPQGARVVDFGIPEGYMATRLEQLLRVIALGRKHGATHIAVC